MSHDRSSNKPAIPFEKPANKDKQTKIKKAANTDDNKIQEPIIILTVSIMLRKGFLSPIVPMSPSTGVALFPHGFVLRVIQCICVATIFKKNDYRRIQKNY
ncbi:hypothetical protein TNCV_346161 [Trichonephila clavipes]|nr:hypothetical protein TNCV_346161 [Trichonephila clavipes]